MTNNLDTLATALYVRTDDLLKESPQVGPWRPAVGLAPQLSDAELVTLAVLQALPGFTSEARWVRYDQAHLRHLFPYLPQQSGYNKRLRAARGLIRSCARTLAASTSLWSGDVWVVDSWGLRLHLVCTLHGLPVGFALAGAKADERLVLLDILADESLSWPEGQ